MQGSPGEDEKTLKKTIDFSKKIDADFVQFALCTPFPGTELYEMATEKGLTMEDWDNFFYARTGSTTTPIFKNDSLTHSELKKWNVRAYKEFYLRPSYIWKSLKSIKSIDDLKASYNGLKMFLDMI